MSAVLSFLGLGKLQAIAIGVLVVLLMAAGGAVYVQSLRLDNAKARAASLERDVAEAVRANASLVEQVAVERSALALARELAEQFRQHRDAEQARADSLDRMIREAPRVEPTEACRQQARDACRGDPGVWRSLTDGVQRRP